MTPPHIVPEWYFLPFYAILRSIPDKLLGVIAMFGSILILFVLPWLDTSPVRSATYRPVYQAVLLAPGRSTCILLGYCRVASPPEGSWLTIGRIATAYYFLHFLVIMPLIGLLETPRPLPASISEAVLPPRSEVRAGRVRAGEVSIMSRMAPLAALVLLGLTAIAAPALAAEEKLPAKDVAFSFEGPFGTFDRAQLQRGYQVYKEVCSACHSMTLLRFRNLGEPGGPEFPPEQVKAMAAELQGHGWAG